MNELALAQLGTVKVMDANKAKDIMWEKAERGFLVGLNFELPEIIPFVSIIPCEYEITWFGVPNVKTPTM